MRRERGKEARSDDAGKERRTKKHEKKKKKNSSTSYRKHGLGAAVERARHHRPGDRRRVDVVRVPELDRLAQVQQHGRRLEVGPRQRRPGGPGRDGALGGVVGARDAKGDVLDARGGRELDLGGRRQAHGGLGGQVRAQVVEPELGRRDLRQGARERDGEPGRDVGDGGRGGERAAGAEGGGEADAAGFVGGLEGVLDGVVLPDGGGGEDLENVFFEWSFFFERVERERERERKNEFFQRGSSRCCFFFFFLSSTLTAPSERRPFEKAAEKKKEEEGRRKRNASFVFSRSRSLQRSFRCIPATRELRPRSALGPAPRRGRAWRAELKKANRSASARRCFFFAVRLSFSLSTSPSPFSLAVAVAAACFPFFLSPHQNRKKNTKLTTPSAVRVSRLARWSNWNTPSPREPVQRSSVGV